MRKVIYLFNVSLDGFIEGPNRNLDWSIVDEELHNYFKDLDSTMGTFLYGRRLYETMSYWQTAETNPSSSAYELEYARMWKNVPKIVFSKTLDHVEGNARLVRDDAAVEIAKLKKQPGKDMSVGGASLASSLMPLGLIDEFSLCIHPVILGSGTPMFPALHDRINLRLIETRTFGSGVVLLRYQLAEKG